MTWEEQFQAFCNADEDSPEDDRPARMVVIATRKACRKSGALDSTEGWNWIEAALRDRQRLGFVHAVFAKRAAPERLGAIFLKLGVEEMNPSLNRFYIEPAVRSLGERSAMTYLLKCLREGSDNDKAGAVSALYWIRSRGAETELREIRAQFNDEMLRQFVTCGSVDVQRRIVPMLSSQPGHYSPDVAALVPEAMRIACTHADPYVRHRIEIVLGGKVAAFQPLP